MEISVPVLVPKSVCDELASYMVGRDRDALLFSGRRGGGALRVKVARESWFDDAIVEASLPGELHAA